MTSFNLASLALAILALALGIAARDNPAQEPRDPALNRPVINVGPYTTGKPFPASPPRDRNRVCRVTGSGSMDRDDSQAILEAMHQCNDGGGVILEGKITVAKALDLTFLRRIDVAITGTIKFTDDVAYWTANSFKYPFQDSCSFWKWGGEDVNIFGHGVGEMDGSGQVWYNRFKTDKALLRPILFLTDGLHGARISGLRMLNPPSWFNLYHNSTDVIVSDLHLHASSSIPDVEVKNTDGFDTLRSSNIIVQNSVVQNTDDCVSFKPNTSAVVIQNLACTGSHGISVGSLGQYHRQVDVVEDLYVYNTSMADASDGARLKVWPDRVPGSDAVDAGGGRGRVRNVTYHEFRSRGCDSAITVDQCYGQKNQTLCRAHPSRVTMEDVLFRDFTGTTSKRYDPRVGQLVCSAPEVCLDFRSQNINVRNPSGREPLWICEGFDTSRMSIKCHQRHQVY
ncbi:hypothetical protein MCOR07_003860 [Pyricularia oryzae]|nr:hypothetical protein MCOR31_010135 [Pyricularia oryzae]KAI6427357.1 hypothetical protein MCOR21_006151 [Pyricularia oryzae]KAI6427923.1 hypothetical protein MCOR22_010580 [Pyricularia oryzae]KAI6580133.1 hypothetical protein MCOR06_009724 [Pyricularia oryzae]KAI6586494.1 hypothetical protein MCOR12_009873 [Pyricularia oryzae]